MPTYPYHCSRCDHDFDVFQKITDAPEATCPQCGDAKANRKIAGGSAVFQFKGSGFYLTDYKSKDNGQGSVPSPAKGGCCPCGKPPSSGGCSSNE